jgi:polysaccharide export outer membrane protein
LRCNSRLGRVDDTTIEIFLGIIPIDCFFQSNKKAIVSERNKSERVMGHLKTLLVGLIMTLFGTMVAAQSEYQIRAGDTLKIEVLEDSGLNRATVVLSDGRISFPFAGTLRVSGRTVGEVEASITSAISSNFAAEPNVFVSVEPGERAQQQTVVAAPAPPPTIDVYFLGEVGNPGLKEVAPGTTFLQAMAQSGGLTRFAADKRIQLRRTDHSSGQTYMFEINYSAILDGAELRNNVEILEGDVIVVPERRLFE